MKRFFALILALVMVCAVAAGCSNKTTTTAKDPLAVDEETQKLYDTVVLTVNDTEITYELYRYYYHTFYAAMTEEDPDCFKEEGALKELQDAVLGEIKMMVAVRELAEKYGIEPTEEELKEIETYVSSLKSYMGDSFATTLKNQYTTEKVLTEMLVFEQYIYAGLYEYFVEEGNKAIDMSDEAVAKFIEDYNCVVHILLSEDRYDTKENLEKVAGLLRELVLKAENASVSITKDSALSDAVAALEEFTAAYEEAKGQMSYIGGLSVYIDRLNAIKAELQADADEHPSIDYLKSTADKLSGETAIMELKNFASDLKNEGIGEDTLTDWNLVYTAYNDMMIKEKDAFSQTEAEWPSTQKQDALLALELVGAMLKDQGKDSKSNTLTLLSEKLADAFVEVTLVFGEDQQDPERGVYFQKGETDEAFEKAYFELELNEVSQPVYTEFGLHLIRKVQKDQDYFKDTMYAYYAGDKMVIEKGESYEVTFEEIYETITFENLK
ncbi:MAG: peptidylprolyl isomerase [Clostridia bacterium]|nr:peptidylprolyl isomerase [Clostridia bacterium]